MQLDAVGLGDGRADPSNAGRTGAAFVEMAGVDFGRNTDKVARCSPIDRERRDDASSGHREPIGDRPFQILGVVLAAADR